MKKIMIAAAIVCVAVTSQAAAFAWKTGKSNNVNAPDGQTMAAATAYIFESTAASSILEAFVAGNDWTAGALNSGSVTAAGKVTGSSEFTYGGEGTAATINAIFAFTEKIGDVDYLYISSTATQSAGAVGSETISFAEAGVSATAKDIKAGYAGAGWYAQSVPEPTSGLLLLLGMAGMALRRRRA